MIPKHLRWTQNNELARSTPALEPAADPVQVRDLTSEQIGVVYQPIVDAHSGELFAHEVLVRCTVPALQPPPKLFQHAVEERACGRLGRLIREKAVASACGAPLFLNIHPDELTERWLVRPDDPIGFCPQPVFLEITETAAFQNHALCDSVLREVCTRTGAQLVIDDFGAGHSNLTRLLDLDPAIVKLDLALVRDVQSSPKKRAVVRSVTALCHELGAKVVAEGIESEQELCCLQGLGVDYLQGYLLGRPANPAPSITWPASVPRAPVPRSASALRARAVTPPERSRAAPPAPASADGAKRGVPPPPRSRGLR
jgi:EAL domain-containing protein (putative c-di-GMP-specific phosphodiesterase class I)